jgi:UDP-N-acetylmuramoyl-L-alanyl-D-glutamate--2,6-diaminopimelate ligase
MQVQQILGTLPYTVAGMPIEKITTDVRQIAIDSRQADAESIFVAVVGTQVDGHDFIAAATQNGCRIVVCMRLPDVPNADVCYIQLADTQKSLGILAANFYGQPSQKMRVVGTTGTNGKTTISTLLYQLFTELGYTVGLISTVSYRIGLVEYPSKHTTPDAVRLQALFAEMRDFGCQYVFMEVSSHAAHQHRIAATQFAGAIFSNLTHDHLDYHGTFRAYIDAKKMFFDALPKTAFALVNTDDRQGAYMLQNCKARHYGYALAQPADFKAQILENHISGLHLDINGQEVYSRLVGDFNAYNLLATYAAATLLLADELDGITILAVLSRLNAAEGRFETVPLVQKPNVLAIVDYAHTPDALEKVLQTLDALRTTNARIITVVGCGGDRDKTKRPIMAKIACSYSQHIILTSDNPRTENPDDILQDMQRGIPPNMSPDQIQIISDRRAAIRQAIHVAQQQDIVLIAGKGHEKYQEINGIRYDFDDKQIAVEVAAEN